MTLDQEVAHDEGAAPVEHGEGIRDALGHVGFLLHEGRANSGGKSVPVWRAG